MSDNPTLSAALEYAAQGLAVFPLLTEGEAARLRERFPDRKWDTKSPRTKNGFKDASTDPEKLQKWFSEPRNIGIAIPEGYWVADVDPRNGGNVADFAGAPVERAVLTGSGGHHIWFKGEPTGLPKVQGVDVKRGGTGYLVAPPSIHPVTGKPYQWLTRGEPAAWDGSGARGGSMSLEEFFGIRDDHVAELVASSDPIPMHSQHETLRAIAGHVLAKYPLEIARKLYDDAVARCENYSVREAERLWRWVLEKQEASGGLVEADDSADSGADVFPEDDEFPEEETPPGGREELRRLEAKEWAMSRREEKVAGKLPLPMFKTAQQMLEEPEPPLEWRVTEILPIQSVAVLHAAAKVGKSTILGHMVHSLLTGEPFLDHWDVNATERNVVLADLELSERVLRAWSKQFENGSDRLRIASLRGNSRAMDVLNDRHFERIVRVIADQDPGVLMIDPLGPMLGARGIEENDNGAVRSLLDRLMALKERTGAEEMIVSHHAGHGGTKRTRGASVFLDWPDVLIGAKRKNEDDPASPRILWAYGRDVMLPDTELSYDPITQALTVAQENEEAFVSHVVINNPGMQFGEIMRHLKDADVKLSATSLRRQLADLIAQEVIRTEVVPGKGAPLAYYPAEPS